MSIVLVKTITIDLSIIDLLRNRHGSLLDAKHDPI
jgi:hypothetical protein